MDLKTATGYFVGYAEKSKGFRFYCPQSFTRIAESYNAKFIGDEVDHGIGTTTSFVFEEDSQAAESSFAIPSQVNVLSLPLPTLNTDVPSLPTPTPFQPPLESKTDILSQTTTLAPSSTIIVQLTQLQLLFNLNYQPTPSPTIRKSFRTRKSAIFHMTIWYICKKNDYDVGDVDDKTTYKEAMTSPYASY